MKRLTIIFAFALIPFLSKGQAYENAYGITRFWNNVGLGTRGTSLFDTLHYTLQVGYNGLNKGMILPMASTSLSPMQGGFFYSPVDSSIYYSNGFGWTKIEGLSASDFHDSLAANALDVLYPLVINATNKTLSADTTMKDSSLVNYRQMKQYVGTNAYIIKNINVATTGTVQLLSVLSGSIAFILTKIEIIQTSTTGTNPTISIGYTSPGYSDFFGGTFGMAGQYNTAIPSLSGDVGIPSGSSLYLNITTAGTGTIAILIEGFYL